MFFKQEHKCEPCSRNCAICPYVRNTHTFTNFEGKTFNVNNYINCTTANVAYALFCKHCDKFIYVGKNRELCFLWTKISFKFLCRLNAKICGVMQQQWHRSSNFENIQTLNYCTICRFQQLLSHQWGLKPNEWKSKKH
jgi:hypothetical protein